jgi:hypothetical protein
MNHHNGVEPPIIEKPLRSKVGTRAQRLTSLQDL